MTQEERQEMLARHNAWLNAHPFWSWGITIWLVLFIFDLAEGLKYLLNQLAR